MRHDALDRLMRHRMPRLRLAAGLLLVAVVSLAGCERTPDLETPATHDGPGVSFSYPGNWDLEVTSEGERGETLRTMTIESPGSTIVMIMEFAPPQPVSLEVFADEVGKEIATAIQDYTSVGSVEPIKISDQTSRPYPRQLAGQQVEGIERTFTLSVLDEPAPHRARFFQVQTPDRSVVIMVQAPSEDWTRVEPGVEHILDSLTTT